MDWSGCVVQPRSRVKDLFSQVGYDSCLAALTHVKSIIRVVQPRSNIRSHSVPLWCIEAYKSFSEYCRNYWKSTVK